MNYLSFINCFQSVETIRVSDRDLRCLNLIQRLDDPKSIQRGCKNIFPHLTTVVLVNTEYPRRLTAGKETTNFVVSRIKLGHPLSVLDLTQATRVAPSALELLGEIAGLEVLLNTNEVVEDSDDD